MWSNKPLNDPTTIGKKLFGHLLILDNIETSLKININEYNFVVIYYVLKVL
jgi:hypothetical protein